MTAEDAKPVLELYAQGRLSLMRAAEQLGFDVSVSEVIVWTYQLGLTPPRASAAVERAELERARAMFTDLDGKPPESAFTGAD